jgi:hypothetical protein
MGTAAVDGVKDTKPGRISIEYFNGTTVETVAFKAAKVIILGMRGVEEVQLNLVTVTEMAGLADVVAAATAVVDAG